ncbi:MAG TPA: AAA family ATPase, partial [Candidatus Dormibacteraeota bacterium]|nr:AAA family ATPase [Candidatus Dormibacteraeota bacterium]
MASEGSVAAAPGVSPVMIGRDSELARLEDALLVTLRGQSRVIVLSGEAGVGKSRLVAELRRRARSTGCAAIVGECPETDLALPYLPFVEAIGNMLSGGADVAEIRTALGTDSAPLSRVLPVLGDGESFTSSSSPLDKLRLFEAMVTLLRVLAAKSKAGALLLALEDVHWIDRSTQELLDYLTRRLSGLHALVVVTHRALDRQHSLQPTLQRWRRAGLSETIPLLPLAVDEVATMIAAIRDLDEPPAELAKVLHARSEGNPFAVEEMLREAASSGGIETRDGRWDAAALATMPPPRAIADSIMVRVERLPDETVAMLRAAAAFGRSFDASLLQRVLQSSDAALATTLRAALHAELLEEDAQHIDAYRFRHE